MQKMVRFSRQGQEDFFAVLTARVNQYFDQNNIPRTGNTHLYIKSVAMYAIFLLPVAVIVAFTLPAWAVWLCYAVVGVGMSGVGLCVMHDANHGTFSKLPWVNRLMSYSMNMIGGSAFTWYVQHNVRHHSFTNIYEMDEDIHDKPFLRLSPEGKLKSYHRFQHLYAFPLYALSTLSWLLVKDYRQLAEYNKEGITRQHGYSPLRELLVMTFSKLAFVFVLLVLPILAGTPWWVALVGFLLMNVIAGLYITIVFQLAHVIEETTQYKLPEGGRMENTWAIHQLTSTANFACNNRIVTWLVGGLNFQVEHHLFPSISHVHYPEISKIVKQTTQEFDLPYYEHRYIADAFKSHVQQLRHLGTGTAIAV